MIIWSWIFLAIADVEKNSSTIVNGKWLYTTFWIATLLCLLLAANEYIQLSRLNAPKYVKSDFEKLVWSYVNNEWFLYWNSVIEYFMSLTKSDKKLLIDDFDTCIKNITHDIWGMQLKIKKFELYAQYAEVSKEDTVLEKHALKLLNQNHENWNPIKFHLFNELDVLNWKLSIYMMLNKKMKSMLKTSFI